jgi:hypothetical protein
MRMRKGKFAVAVSEGDYWVAYSDLSEEKDGLKEVLERAREYAKEHGEWVAVYIADREITIEPSEKINFWGL